VLSSEKWTKNSGSNQNCWSTRTILEMNFSTLTKTTINCMPAIIITVTVHRGSTPRNRRVWWSNSNRFSRATSPRWWPARVLRWTPRLGRRTTRSTPRSRMWTDRLRTWACLASPSCRIRWDFVWFYALNVYFRNGLS